jgi:hypothetical protein
LLNCGDVYVFALICFALLCIVGTVVFRSICSSHNIYTATGGSGTRTGKKKQQTKNNNNKQNNNKKKK